MTATTKKPPARAWTPAPIPELEAEPEQMMPIEPVASAPPPPEPVVPEVIAPARSTEPAPAPDADDRILNSILQEPAQPPISIAGSRIQFSLGSIGCMVAAASIAIL